MVSNKVTVNLNLFEIQITVKLCLHGVDYGGIQRRAEGLDFRPHDTIWSLHKIHQHDQLSAFLFRNYLRIIFEYGERIKTLLYNY